MARYGSGSVPIATGWKCTNCRRTHRSSIPRSASGNTRARPALTTDTSRPPRNWSAPCPGSSERCNTILSQSDPICFLFADRYVPLIMRGCITGRTSPYPANVAAGSLEFSVALPPAGSLLLVAKDVPGPPAATPQPAAGQAVESRSPLTVARTSPNAIRIDYCDLTLNGVTKKDVYFFKAADEVFKAFGFAEGDPWTTALQFKTSILDRNKFAPDSGFEATFWFDVAEGVNTASLRAVVERTPLWKVSVNGNPVESERGQWWLDVDFGVYQIDIQP